MKSWILGAAAAVALSALSFGGPAQARMANPSLAIEHANPGLQQTHYRRYRHSHSRRHWNRDRDRSWRGHRYRRCWNDRVRVRTPIGSFVYRTVRRCGWRYR